ncbi:non-heme iron oxygenase ferredoxin subunit [Falsiroseomonas selenitidurans]|uniref:Non-heme iron oxygenase ferredoxin subunit n=1 Tax=Falsiroseomonas selenitidurans TaxID=2716335 RepID=A0ABX1DY97_9PROT|nr:non-heme iron oxygenase ferredoxin subunit [Falsiroseomonas selenitidurans]NKC29870.1 non-heme iron oxygenase ferredoxin subunit [Falsiroseomonas selenitidurans]
MPGGLLRLCAMESIPEGQARRVETAVADFAVFNLGGAFFVTANACTHGPGNLGHGPVQGGEVVCEAHGGRFDIRSGRATRLPCTEALMVWEAVLRDDAVWIDFAAGRVAD